MISLNQLKTGNKIIYRAIPHEVINANHSKVGRGGAKLNTKLRNLIDGTVIDYTFAGEEKLEEAQVTYRQAQFLYSENEQSYFMLTDDYSQLSAKINNNKFRYLSEGQAVDLVLWQEKIIDLRLPSKIEVIVKYTEPGIKGDRVSTGTKAATLENNTVIQVPLFVKTGDRIILNTDSGEYVSRA